MYNNKVLDIFKNPQHHGKLHKADASGKAGRVEDGDVIKLYAQIKGGKFAEVTFEACGCVSAIVCSSVLADVVHDKTIEEALQLKEEDIFKVVDDLPFGKEHGATLALAALADLVLSYRKRLLKEGKITEEEFKNATLDKSKKAKKEKAKKTTKVKKITKKVKKETKKVEMVEEKPEVVQEVATEEKPAKREMRGVGNLMLLSKKITTTKTTTTTNTTK